MNKDKIKDKIMNYYHSHDEYYDKLELVFSERASAAIKIGSFDIMQYAKDAQTIRQRRPKGLPKRTIAFLTGFGYNKFPSGSSYFRMETDRYSNLAICKKPLNKGFFALANEKRSKKGAYVLWRLKSD